MAIRIASYNVENLFSRPKAFNLPTWAEGKPIVAAYQQLTTLFNKPTYSSQDKRRMKELMVQLDLYRVRQNGTVFRVRSPNPRWAWLRKNRGSFDKQPADTSKNVEIVAKGRADWIGWVELAREATDEVGTRMTAKVIKEVDADIIGIVEAEDRPSLVRLNSALLDGLYKHVMLIDGNDSRGIDVGIMEKKGFELRAVRSNVDLEDAIGVVFGRDCPEYEVVTKNGASIFVLANHFKSQSGGGGDKRLRQAKAVRAIAKRLIDEGKHVVVLGDLNEGPKTGTARAENLQPLYTANRLLDCYSLSKFDVGKRPGTFDSCGLRNRLDYIFISRSLEPAFVGGEVFRKGLWGTRKTRPDKWKTYPEMTDSTHQASDHAALVIELDPAKL